jgi:hypothetical protein
MVQANLIHLRRVRERTLALLESLSAEQLDYVPEPGEWSVGEVADHLILSEQLLQQDISILIDRAKAGQEPYLYRSFAEFNARPACFPEAILPFLEPILNVVTLFAPVAIREYVIRNVPFRALAPDASLPQKGKAKDILCDELRTNLQATEELFAANPSVDYDKMWHQHPLFGIQTVPQLLRTLWLHEQAHQDQLSSIIASPRFP